jgi:hypothetical protein
MNFFSDSLSRSGKAIKNINLSFPNAGMLKIFFGRVSPHWEGLKNILDNSSDSGLS